MLLGRREYFIKSAESIKNWKRILLICSILIIPFYLLKTYLPGLVEMESVKTPLWVALPSYFNFVFMGILVFLFTLLWFKTDGYKAQRFIIPYGRMTLTNYIVQSIIGVAVYYGFGKWFISKYRHGPLEILWKKGTWIGRKY